MTSTFILFANPESSATFLGLTFTQWLPIIVPIILGGSWLWYYTRKSYRNTMPRIIKMAYTSNAIVDILVLNPSESKIAVLDIYARKIILFSLPFKKLKVHWTRTIHPNDQRSRIPKNELTTQHWFTGQELHRFPIPLSDLKSRKRVYVKTTVGRCSAILAPYRES